MAYTKDYKHLYHYTSFEKARLILQSQSLRMYNVRSQSDPLEIIYTGDIALKTIEDYIKKVIYELPLKLRLDLVMFSIFVAELFSSSEFAKRKIKKIETEYRYHDYYKFLTSIREKGIKFFISCFCNDYNNDNHWDSSYAEHYHGVVIGMNVEDFYNIAGIKRMFYGDEDEIVFLIETILKGHMQFLDHDDDERVQKLASGVIDQFLSIKRKSYEEEQEIRLIESTNDEKEIDICSDGDREYINMQVNKSEFKNRIESIFITDMMKEENANELKDILNANGYSSKIEVLESNVIQSGGLYETTPRINTRPADLLQRNRTTNGRCA